MRENTKGAITFTVLSQGDDLEAGGKVHAGFSAFRLGNGTEVLAKPGEIAEFGRQLVVEFGGQPIGVTGMVSPQCLLVGDPRKGFEIYGPYEEADRDESAEARMAALRETGEDYWGFDLQPMTELVPIQPDPEMVRMAADVEVPGLGVMKRGTYYFVMTRGEGDISAYALIGKELVEASEKLPDGSPDWVNGSICDEVRGDAGFFHPAYNLLRFMNIEWAAGTEATTSWHKHDHDTLTDALRRCRVESWTYDAGQDCYRVSIGADDEFVIRTPMDAAAYVAGLGAVRAAK